MLERCAIRHGLFPPSRGLTAPCLPFPSPLPPLAARALHAHTLPGILGAGASDATNGWPKGVASSTHKLWEVPNGVRSCGGEREVAAVPLASPLPARALRRVVSCALLLAPQGTERVTRAAERNYSRFGFGGSTGDGGGGTARVFTSAGQSCGGTLLTAATCGGRRGGECAGAHGQQ